MVNSLRDGVVQIRPTRGHLHNSITASSVIENDKNFVERMLYNGVPRGAAHDAYPKRCVGQ